MNMIKKTRQKFITITLCAISLVLIAILGILNLAVIGGVYMTGKDNIKMIRDRRGFVFSNSQSETSPKIFESFNDISGKVSYIYIRYSNNREIAPFITTNMSDTYSSDDIYTLANTVASFDTDKGIYNSMMYEVTGNDLSTTIVFVDISNDLSIVNTLFRMSLIIIAISLVAVYIFTYILSKWAMKPLQTSFDNQKRFISDASHELKTPLTVISANVDVLESEIGENKWLDNIKHQTTTMAELVYALLDSAKLSETGKELIMTQFNLSDAVLSKALEFECTAFEEHKRFEQNINENIMYKGNEDSIKQLTGILIDNAIKHSDVNGLVRVTLTSNGSKKILQVYNTGNGLKNDEKDKIFERFYRSDTSRSKETGGYGLGLSIAKSIAEAHSGTITVDGEENKWINFTVIL